MSTASNQTDYRVFSAVDYYDFLGYRLEAKSNSRDILEHLKAVYGKFYIGTGHEVAPFPDSQVKSAQYALEFVDEIAASGLLTLRSEQHGTHKLRCINLHAFDYDYYKDKFTVPSPLAYIQWFTLDNVCLLAKNYQLIHAGAVSWKNQGIIFPAVSGRGKTTLTLKMIQQGCEFLSDEIACLNHVDDMVAPFYRTINLSDHSRRLLGLPPVTDVTARKLGEEESEWMLDIEHVVPACLAPPCPLKYIIFLQGFADRPQLQQVSISSAIFRLLSFSFSPKPDPAQLLFNLASIMHGVACFDLVVGDLNETADHILHSLASRSRTKRSFLDRP